MRKNQTSLTAMGIAMARAVESERPADERICYDPYARQFIAPWIYTVLGFLMNSGYTEWRGPGVNGFLVARDRYIDDTLQSALDQGLPQLVILGAGFDSRPYRFAALQSGVKIYEVDHPATQKTKLEKLQKIFGKRGEQVPDQVTYVPIDFNLQTLEEGLLGSSYDPGLKTLFIWQGVCEYLAPPAVDATLHFVVHHSAPGSAIVFDYIYQEVLEERVKQNEVSNMRRYRFMTGEGLTFGLPQGSVEAFLKARGFNQVCDTNAEDLKRLYFHGKNATRKVVGGYGIAIGVV